MKFRSIGLAAALAWLPVSLFAQGLGSSIPVADAGPDQNVEVKEWVGLEGRASRPSNLGYSWVQTAGPPVPLMDAGGPAPYFRYTSPLGVNPITLTWTLTVTNPVGQSSSDSCDVTIYPRPSEFLGDPTGISPYRTGPGQLTKREAQHFLRRATWGANPDQVDALIAMGTQQWTQAQLMTPTDNSQLHNDAAVWSRLDEEFYCDIPDPGWPDLYDAEWGSVLTSYVLYTWIHDDLAPLRQKLFYFWHDLFSTSVGATAQNMEANNEMGTDQILLQEHFRYWLIDFYRRNTIPRNYRQTLLELSTEGAMLEWLDGAGSKAADPNENFARELLELFTLGETGTTSGTANYNEADVKTIARALVGWEFGFETWCSNPPHKFIQVPAFNANEHGGYMGTVTWGGQTSVPVSDLASVIGAILDHPQSGQFIAKEIWDYFIGTTPDPAVLDYFAGVLATNGWDLAGVIEEVLLSEAMFSPEARGNKVTPPVQHAVDAMRSMGIQYAENQVFRLDFRLRNMGHRILFPPSVDGWAEDSFWVNMGNEFKMQELINDLLQRYTYNPTSPNYSLDLHPLSPEPGLWGAASWLQSLATAKGIDPAELNEDLFSEWMDFMAFATDGLFDLRLAQPGDGPPFTPGERNDFDEIVLGSIFHVTSFSLNRAR